MSANSDRHLSWKKRLNQIVEDLDSLVEQTGSNGHQNAGPTGSLKVFNEECRTSIADVIDAIEQHQGLNLDAFDDSHRRLSSSTTDTLSTMTESLNSLMVKVNDIHDLKTTLEEVSYSIKNISLLMKIKTTKMGKSEFDHVVKGLESLAGQIKENTEGINLSALEASENITDTCEEIEERLARFNRLFKPSREQVDDLQELVHDMVTGSLKQCKQMKTLADRNGQLIESIEGAIVRQAEFQGQLNEIRQALSGVISSLTAETNDAAEEDMLRSIADILTRQLDQFGIWEHDLETIERGIMGDFSTLRDTVVEQSAAGQVLTETASVLKGKMVAFEKEFDSVLSASTFSKQKTHELQEAIAGINDNVSNVSRQVSHIEIGRNDLEALTYNAVFKAAKVGMQGKVMESITNEITGLSREMHSKVSKKEAVIKSIVASSKEFKGSLSEQLSHHLDFSTEMNLKIREQCQKFYEDIDAVTAVLDKTLQLQEFLKQASAGDFQGQDLSGWLQKAQMGLADILGEMR
jgi:ribosome-associated translation inhibitor RaiA